MDWYFKAGSIILKNTFSKDAVSIILFHFGSERRIILLDSNDLSAIAEIVEHAIRESEVRMAGLIQGSETHMTGLIQESETRMTGLIQESETCVTGLIQESETRMTGLIQKSVQETETRTTGLIQKSIQKSETRMTKQMKKMIYKSESMLLDEMDRYDKKNEKRFDKIEHQLEGLKDIYRITKNEAETINILLRAMDNFEKRLTALEVRTATA